MPTGEIYSLQLKNWDREKQALIDLPAFGLVKTIALVGDTYFVAALDTFHSSPLELRENAPVLITQTNVALRRKGGANIFFHGRILPDQWHQRAIVPLSDEERKLSHLYQTWKNKDLPLRQTLAAYEKLGSVSEGLSEIEASLAWEWRFRFDLKALEQEDKHRRQRIAAQKKPDVSWADVLEYEVHFHDASLHAHATKAYKALVKTLKRRPKTELVEKALSTFFIDLSTHDLSTDYRDEIISIAKNVGQACGVDSKNIYDIFEKSRS